MKITTKYLFLFIIAFAPRISTAESSDSTIIQFVTDNTENDRIGKFTFENSTTVSDAISYITTDVGKYHPGKIVYIVIFALKNISSTSQSLSGTAPSIKLSTTTINLLSTIKEDKKILQEKFFPLTIHNESLLPLVVLVRITSK